MAWSIQSNLVEPYFVIRQSLQPLQLSRWQFAKLFITTVLQDVPVVAIIVGLILSGMIVVHLLTAKPRPKFSKDLPVIKRNEAHFENILREGRQLYPDTPYLAVNRRHSYVVFPARCFDELKRLPETKASAKDFFHTANFGSWTYIGHETHTLLKTIIADLTRALPARVFNRQQDARMAFDSIVGYCPDWKEMSLIMTVFEIVANINACSFVGRKLGSNKSWVKAVMQSPLVIHVAVVLMNACPAFLRPYLAPLAFLPTKKNQWDMRRLLTPFLEEDHKAFVESKDKSELLRPKTEGDIPLTAMLLNRYKPGQGSIKQLTIDYILMSFDSTPSTASAIYYAICELAQHPEVVEVLRTELQETMVDGKLPSTHLQELKRLDSFLRESFRMHPVSLFSLQRVTTQPCKLSVGPTIPAGVIMGVDAYAINRSPTLWTNPDTFDPNRFHNLRQTPGNENRYHLLVTGSDSPGWGDGTQACPGRFFATSTIKIAFAHLLMNYDVVIPSEQLPPKVTPLENGTWAPDMNIQVKFKSRF